MTSYNRAELWTLREAMGLTRAELARVLHIREDTLRKWEYGHGPIPAKVRDEVEALCGETREREAELFSQWTRDGQQSPPPVRTYATDEAFWSDYPWARDRFPARWHRHLAARVFLEYWDAARFAEDQDSDGE